MTDRNEPTIRLFYAFELTEPVRELAVNAQSNLIDRLGRRGVRWTPSVDMHVTALFLGNYSNECLSTFDAAGSVAASAAAPFDFAVGGLGRFPEHGHPRVVWLGGHESAQKPASALIKRLRAELSILQLDAKPFRPHITLGYVRPTADGRAVDSALDTARSTGERTLRVERLVLMQTIPDAERRNSAGARYTTVQVFPLGTDT